jgi:peptidoglycan hydrolase CwlO-like protein
MSEHRNTISWVGVSALAAAVAAAVYVSAAFAGDPQMQDAPEQDLAKTVINLELRIDHLENELKQAKAERRKQTDAIEEVKKETTGLTQRLERLDRNTVGQLERDIDDMERDINDLERRVRRLE